MVECTSSEFDPREVKAEKRKGGRDRGREREGGEDGGREGEGGDEGERELNRCVGSC